MDGGASAVMVALRIKQLNQSLGGFLKAAMREMDVAARFNSQEYALLLPRLLQLKNTAAAVRVRYGQPT